MKRNERGSVTLVVLVTVLFIVILLSSFLVYVSSRRRAQLKETKEIVASYDGDMEKVYNSTMKNRSKMLSITGKETTNTETEDVLGNKIVVPAGFKVVNPEDNVTDGIVIEDISAGDETSKGNQYVWVPVSHVDGEKINTIKDSQGKEHTIELARYTFNTDGNISTKTLDGSDINTSYVEETSAEHISSGYENGIAIDIEAFKNSVKNKGGYYLARYEAGDPNQTDRNQNSSENIIPVFKDNQTVYNCITQPNSASVVKKLYTTQNSKYISDLVNSYAWDTAIVFIQEFSGDKEYSKRNRLQTTMVRTGQATDGQNKDVRCNIYDMAGNVLEWTTETYKYTTLPCVNRGGYSTNEEYLTDSRYSSQVVEAYSAGFRRDNIFTIMIKLWKDIEN